MEKVPLSPIEISDVEKAFGLHFETVKQLNGGLANSNHLGKTADSEYVIKVCLEKTGDQLLVLSEAHNFLASRGIKVPRCIPRVDSTSCALVSSTGKSVLLFEYLNGTPGSKITARRKQLQVLGRELAKVHNLHPSPNLGSVTLPFYSMSAEEMLCFIQNTTLSDHEYIIFLKERLLQMQANLEHPDLAEGILHGDLFLDNAIFDDQDELVGIIDFEEVCFGKRIFDVAMTLCGCCFTEDGKFNAELADNFLFSYHEIFPLNENEKKRLITFIHFSLAAVSFWLFRQFFVLFPSQTGKDYFQFVWQQWSHFESQAPTLQFLAQSD